MDIKKRIQELSLDQKAKLYFMGLVRKGVIDTLPEDPKAAYIKDMMGKMDTIQKISPKADRSSLEKLAGMEDEDFKNPILDKYLKLKKSIDYKTVFPTDLQSFVDSLDNTERDGLENDLAEGKLLKEDKLKMAYAAYDKAEMNGDIRGQELALAVIDLLKSGELKEIATELGYLKEMKVTDKDGNDVTSDIIKQLEKSLKKSGYKIAKEEVDGMEGGIDLNAISAKKASFVYTEQGGRFYSLTLSTSDGQTLKMKYDEANEWLKDTLAYIHEGDLIPRRYNSGLEDLDLIVARLKELGIEASHGDYMDVS